MSNPQFDNEGRKVADGEIKAPTFPSKQQLDELQALLDAAPKPASDWFPLFQRGVQWETAKLWISLHNSAPSLLQAAREAIYIKGLVKRLIDDLPIKRDWLNPVIEAELKAINQGKGPA